MTQLVAKLDPNEYMSFGLSGDDRRSQMIGGDVTVAWMDHGTGEGMDNCFAWTKHLDYPLTLRFHGTLLRG